MSNILKAALRYDSRRKVVASIVAAKNSTTKIIIRYLVDAQSFYLPV